MPMMCLGLSAQEKGPKKGDFTLALTLGYNASVMQSAAAGNESNYNIAATSTNWNDKKLTVGIEGGWFFLDLWKLNLGGGMNIFNVYTGVDRYFRTKIDGLMPYIGLRAGYAYGRERSMTDDETYMGESVGEAFNIRGAITAGVDYFFTDAFFIGAEVDPFAYTYNRTLIKPQEGLSNLDADSHNFGILAAPTLKIGFKF